MVRKNVKLIAILRSLYTKCIFKKNIIFCQYYCICDCVTGWFQVKLTKQMLLKYIAFEVCEETILTS